MKICFKCNKEKPLSEFYKHPKMADGHLNKCKECNKKDVRKNYSKSPEHYKKYDKKRELLPHRIKAREDYAKTEQGISAGNKAKRKYANRNPIKVNAQSKLTNAVRDGKIIKQYFCQICSIENVIIHGHHCDYSKPLEVMWLCSKCHKEWHQKYGEALNP